MRLSFCSRQPRLKTLLFLGVLISSFSKSNAQAIDPDLVVWTTVAGWKDLKYCLQECLNQAPYDVGCKTNACLCRPDTQGLALQSLSSRALSTCSDYQDQSTAVSMLTAYCDAKGYTSSIIAPTVLQTTGACTFTSIPTKTQYVTAYVTIYHSGSTPAWHNVKLGAICLACVAILQSVLWA
jgi:hypothetical protein